MHYVILAYPKLSSEDYTWIQEVRKQHDRQYSMVEPHFTLVFPTTKLSESEIMDHVHSIALGIKPFEFQLTTAKVETNHFPKAYQVHLVANTPIPEIVELHDALYVEKLASELRKDIPYVPHITVASDPEEVIIKDLSQKLNQQEWQIIGRIDEITICSFDGSTVQDIEKISL